LPELGRVGGWMDGWAGSNYSAKRQMLAVWRSSYIRNYRTILINDDTEPAGEVTQLGNSTEAIYDDAEVTRLGELRRRLPFGGIQKAVTSRRCNGTT
jgi:hypothetical protein